MSDPRLTLARSDLADAAPPVHALRDGRSVLLLRSSRVGAAGARSNILWNYGHTTIPRHLRDVFVTEYGIADLRGKSDSRPRQ